MLLNYRNSKAVIREIGPIGLTVAHAYNLSLVNFVILVLRLGHFLRIRRSADRDQKRCEGAIAASRMANIVPEPKPPG